MMKETKYSKEKRDCMSIFRKLDIAKAKIMRKTNHCIQVQSSSHQNVNDLLHNIFN